MPDRKFPEQVKVEDISQKHPVFETSKKAWRDITLMCKGGNELRRCAPELLFQRPTEPTDTYQIRQRFLGHPNHMGTGLGWYEAALFGKDPQIAKKSADGKAIQDGDPAKDPFLSFEKNCDGGGTKLVDYYRQFARDLLMYGRGYRLIDMPKAVALADSRAEQKELMKPRLVRYDPLCVINWDEQDNGILNWIFIETKSIEGTDDFPPKALEVDRWYFFDTTQYAVYERRYLAKDGKKSDYADLVDFGPHALSSQGRVPVDRTILSEAYWLANRAYLPSLAYLNCENWLLWILFLCNLPMLVVKGDLRTDVQVSEHQWTHLEANSDMKWIEPEGGAIDKLLATLERLLEEIFRAMYLISQARSLHSSSMEQSGISKQMDMVPSYEVLAAIGDVVREAMTRTFSDLNGILDTDVTTEVSGFNFKERDSEDIIGLVQDLQVLQVPSDTLRKQMFKEAATEALGPDPDQDMLDKIFAEIDASPTMEELQQQAQQLQQQKMEQQFDQQLKQTNDLAA